MRHVVGVCIAACGCQSTDSDTVAETGETDDVDVEGTGAFLVPHGADTNGDGYIETLFFDAFAFSAPADL